MTDMYSRGMKGWAGFASLLFMLGGAFNLIAGIAALAVRDKFQEDAMLYANLRLAAIFWLMLGVLQLISSLLIHRRMPSGRILGVFVALLSACVWFFAIDARPLSALIVIAVDVLLMWGLIQAAEEFPGSSLPPEYVAEVQVPGKH